MVAPSDLHTNTIQNARHNLTLHYVHGELLYLQRIKLRENIPPSTVAPLPWLDGVRKVRAARAENAGAPARSRSASVTAPSAPEGGGAWSVLRLVTGVRVSFVIALHYYSSDFVELHRSILNKTLDNPAFLTES